MEDLQNPDEEKDEDDGMPCMTRAPQVKTRRRNITPQSSPTQHVKASGKDASADLKSTFPSDLRQLSDMLDDGRRRGVVHRFLPSHTTASDSTTIENLSSPQALNHPEWKTPVQ